MFNGEKRNKICKIFQNLTTSRLDFVKVTLYNEKIKHELSKWLDKKQRWYSKSNEKRKYFHNWNKGR